MINYVRVSEAPKALKKGEHVIYKPNFLDEIRLAKGKSNANGLTTTGYLRNIFIEIGNKYDENFSAYSHVNLSNYIGIPFKDELELSKIVSKIVNQQLPDAIDKMIDNQIKKMPTDTKMIYYVADDLNNLGVFTRYRISMAPKDAKKSNNNTTVKSKTKN